VIASKNGELGIFPGLSKWSAFNCGRSVINKYLKLREGERHPGRVSGNLDIHTAERSEHTLDSNPEFFIGAVIIQAKKR